MLKKILTSQKPWLTILTNLTYFLKWDHSQPWSLPKTSVDHGQSALKTMINHGPKTMV